MSERILVTGAGGFIGGHLVKRLKDEGCWVRGVDLKLHDEGKLTPAQDQFWNRKPPEELYDLQNDPDEVHNLAGSPAHQEHTIAPLWT